MRWPSRSAAAACRSGPSTSARTARAPRTRCASRSSGSAASSCASRRCGPGSSATRARRAPRCAPASRRPPPGGRRAPPALLRVGVAPAGTVAGPLARRAVLPAAAAEAAARLAAYDERPTRPGDGAVVVVDPGLQAGHAPVAEAERPGAAPEGSSPEEFDALFARTDDPWSYDNAYERQKYDRTLALAPAHVARALELGCAGGRFTVRLAERAGAVTALDVSPFALEHARARAAAADATNITFARHDLFADALPRQAAELVVCSEVLYYAGTIERLRFAVGQLAAAVAEGGVLVTAHARLLVDDDRGFAWGLPFGAASITRELQDSFLRLEAEVVTDAYVVQRWGRPAGALAARLPRRVRRERAGAARRAARAGRRDAARRAARRRR